MIHPPIDVNWFTPSTDQEDYYLVLARLISYKRIDIAIEACSRLGRRLLVIGDGPDRDRLKAKAGPTVQFPSRLSDAEVEHYAARCRALLFPGEEDFGMAPLEPAAAGRPPSPSALAGEQDDHRRHYRHFFDRQEASALAEAMMRFERQEWSATVLRSHAEGFGIDIFQARFRQFLAHVGAPVNQDTAQPFSAGSAHPDLRTEARWGAESACMEGIITPFDPGNACWSLVFSFCGVDRMLDRLTVIFPVCADAAEVTVRGFVTLHSASTHADDLVNAPMGIRRAAARHHRPLRRT